MAPSHAASTPFSDGAPLRGATGGVPGGAPWTSAAGTGRAGVPDGSTYGDGSTTGRPRAELYTDGMGPVPDVLSAPPPPNDPEPSKLRAFVEGPRGLSVRTSVYLRYLVYFVTVVIGSAISHACFARTQWWAGGYLMFAAAITMTATAAAGTWFYTNHRHEIIEQFKHYTLGIAVLPGTGIAILNWASQGLFNGPAAQTEAFIGAMSSALPIIYFVTVVIPAAVFFKVIAGIRSLHRSRLDDQEAWNAYSRIDNLHR